MSYVSISMFMEQMSKKNKTFPRDSGWQDISQFPKGLSILSLVIQYIIVQDDYGTASQLVFPHVIHKYLFQESLVIQ
jgi:hypothetical protein